jgi:isoleucyl-tRNA synthetase
LRNTLRWLLGSLAGFTDAERVPEAEMPELERWVLHRLTELDARIRAAVESYDWTGVYPELHAFCATDLSAFYFDIRKDAIYCDRPDSKRRRAARTVLEHLHRCLTTWLAPVLCFTAEEAWGARFGETDSVHLQLFPTLPEEWHNRELGKRWESIRTIRRRLTTALEDGRSSGWLKSSLQATVKLPLAPEDFELLSAEAWTEIGIVSSLEKVVDPNRAPAVEGQSHWRGDVPPLPIEIGPAPGTKCVRCWRVLEEVGRQPKHPTLCARCADAVESGLVCRPAA